MRQIDRAAGDGRASKAFGNTRICRPVGLSAENRKKVVGYAIAKLGVKYGARRIVDLVRYLFPYPPVPVWFRRRMLAIGSGDRQSSKSRSRAFFTTTRMCNA